MISTQDKWLVSHICTPLRYPSRGISVSSLLECLDIGSSAPVRHSTFTLQLGKWRAYEERFRLECLQKYGLAQMLLSVNRSYLFSSLIETTDAGVSLSSVFGLYTHRSVSEHM